MGPPAHHLLRGLSRCQVLERRQARRLLGESENHPDGDVPGPNDVVGSQLGLFAPWHKALRTEDGTGRESTTTTGTIINMSIASTPPL